MVDTVLRILGLSKCADTIVGNTYIRGISGGERKRVSIAEQFLVGSTIGFYDGSTKGLDSASALDFAKALKLSSRYLGKTNFASLYQASEAVFEQFDRLILLSGGRCIFHGPIADAKRYFEEMGFVCPPRATTPEFLTGVTEREERIIRPGFENSVPSTPEEFEARWLASEAYRGMLAERTEFETTSHTAAAEFSAAYEVYKTTSGKTKVENSYSTTVAEQMSACLKREGELLWGGRKEVIFRTVFSTYADGGASGMGTNPRFFDLPASFACLIVARSFHPHARLSTRRLHGPDRRLRLLPTPPNRLRRLFPWRRPLLRPPIQRIRRAIRNPRDSRRPTGSVQA